MRDQSSAAALAPEAATVASPIVCYVINLARDRERMAAVAAGLSAMGVAFKRHPGVHGKRHKDLIRRCIDQPFFSRAKERPMTDGEIGCSLSHLTLYRRMLREGVEKALILEDDAVFSPAFAGFYAQHLSPLLDRFDIIKIEGIFYDHVSTDPAVLTNAGETKLVLPLRPSLGTAGYAVTRRGAERLLKALVKIDDPLDIKLVQYERHRARYAELRPMLVQQADVVSLLEADRVTADDGDPMPVGSLFDRAAKKMVYVRRVVGRLCVWGVWVLESRLRGARGAVAP